MRPRPEKDHRRRQRPAHWRSACGEQYVPENGAAILFSSMHNGVDVDEVVWETSRYLAHRHNDKLLILDARIANSRDDGWPTWIERTSP